MATNTFLLINQTLKLSNSSTWEYAKLEWKLEDWYIGKNQICACSKYPIKEIIVIRNFLNKNKMIVGNCCIKKFLGEFSKDSYFKALKEKRINKAIILTAHTKDIINDWEQKFLLDVWRKRNLSEKQVGIFKRLKELMLNTLIYAHKEI